MAYTLLSGGCYDTAANKFVDGKYCAVDCKASPSNPACPKPSSSGPSATDYIGAVGNLFGTIFGKPPAPTYAPPVQSGPSVMTMAMLAGGALLVVMLMR